MYKIVHLITSLKVGGAETILYDLINKLDPNLFENHVIYFYEGPNEQKLKNLGVKTYQIKGSICKYDPIFIFRLFRLIFKIKPSCMHSSLWAANVLGVLIARFLKIRIACALHLATNYESNGTNSFLRTKIDKFVLPKADKIIVVSNSMVNELNKNSFSWFPFNNLEIIKNGIDVEFIEQQSFKNKINKTDYFNENYFVIGTVGRFIERKNHKLLIEAFNELAHEFNDIRLMLIGYGPLQTELIELVKKLNLFEKVLFIKSDSAYQYYPLFDCFVLPSYNESFGLVTLEAMLFELACVVISNNHRHEFIINDFNGFIVRNDYHELSIRLKELYINKHIYKQIGINGKETVKNDFNVKDMVQKYEEVFVKLIAYPKIIKTKNITPSRSPRGSECNERFEG